MYVNKKISLGLELSDSNSATFKRIFTIQDVDRSTKHVVVIGHVVTYLSEMLLHEQ